MPRKEPQSLVTMIAAVRAVSPDFARVADLALLGLEVTAAATRAGYEVRKVRAVKTGVEPQPQPVGPSAANGADLA